MSHEVQAGQLRCWHSGVVSNATTPFIVIEVDMSSQIARTVEGEVLCLRMLADIHAWSSPL